MSTFFTTVYTTPQTTPDGDYVYITATGVLQQGLSFGRNSTVYVMGYASVIGDYTGAGSASADRVTVGTSGLVGLVTLDGNWNTVSNAGVITSGLEIGSFGFFYADKPNIIINTGLIETITPDTSSFIPISVTGIADTRISNSGTISNHLGNAIALDVGNDRIDNSGSIFGNISLGEGNNRINSIDGSIFGSITAGNGNNIIRTGNVDANVITGAGSDVIRGGAGDDTIDSGGGADVMFGADGDDVISGGDAIDSLKGQDGDDFLNGGGGTDYLFGQQGSDLLDSGTSANEVDYLFGGENDDTYVLNDTLDVCNDSQYYGGSGIDTVVVKMDASFNLGTSTQLIGDFENLTLSGVTGTENINGTGNAFANVISGNGGANTLSGLDGNDWLSGGAGVDVLYGGSGKDVLEGGAGADTLNGGNDDDTYRVDSTNDTVDETGGGGIDTVLVVTPLFNYSLNDAVHIKGAVENLQFLTYSGTLLSQGTGNALGNSILGNAGRNKFLGLDGNDILSGLDGDDILVGGQGADQFLGGNGTDTADYSGSAVNLTVSLDGSVANTGEAAGDTFSSIEVLIGTDAAAGDLLVGDVGSNSIRGNAGNDNINGRAGGDDITGGLGSDTLTGELGDDRFTYNALAEVGDTITDFSAVTGDNDYFRLNRSVFTGDGVAQLAGPASAASFITRAADHLAQDGNDYFIYQTDTHEFWYDPTGSDIAGDAIRIATLQSGATMTRVDIFLF